VTQADVLGSEVGSEYNGDEEYSGSTIDVNDLNRPDGIITMSRASSGVLIKVMSPPDKTENYRDVMFILNFKSVDDADRFARAINYCKKWDIPLDGVLDQALARCSVKGHRVDQVIGAMTHVMANNNQRKRSSSGNNGNTSSKSPIA